MGRNIVMPRAGRTFRSALLLSAAFAGAAGVAEAQETVLLDSAVQSDFDRGRNVSVNERGRPDYDPLGISAGSFLILPRIEVGAGYSNNIYLRDSNKVDASFLTVSPGVRVNSRWSRHELRVDARGDFRRFVSESRRNEDGYQAGARGRLDLGTDYNIVGEARFSRQYESPLTGDTQSNLAVLSSYKRSYGMVQATRSVGQSRFVASLDYTNLDFNNIKLPAGGVFDQAYRDRDITRATVQAEYAVTPSVSFYVQGSYDWTKYKSLATGGVANRDSEAYRVIGGVNFDFSAYLRGTIGAGYVSRSYDADLYKDVDGISLEGQLEYFPSDLTTFTLKARRLLADATIGNSSAYFDNRLSLRVDHELLRNLILNAVGEVSRQDYLDSSVRSTNYRLSAGGRYLINRGTGIHFTLSYLSRDRNDPGVGNNFSELSGMVSVVFQR